MPSTPLYGYHLTLINAIIAALICSGSVGQVRIISANSAGRLSGVKLFWCIHIAYFLCKEVLWFCIESVKICSVALFVRSASVWTCDDSVSFLYGCCVSSVNGLFGFESPRLQLALGQQRSRCCLATARRGGGLLFSFLILKKNKNQCFKSAQIFCKPRPVRAV